MRNIDVSKLDLKETIVNIRRVTKVVKGGKNSRPADLAPSASSCTLP